MLGKYHVMKAMLSKSDRRKPIKKCFSPKDRDFSDQP